jgi:hypothetical protein
MTTKLQFSAFYIVVLFLVLTFPSCKKDSSQQNTNQQGSNSEFPVGGIKTSDSVYSKIPTAPLLTSAGTLDAKFELDIPSNPIQQGKYIETFFRHFGY